MFSLIRWQLAALNVAVLLIILVLLESGVYINPVPQHLRARGQHPAQQSRPGDPQRPGARSGAHLTFPARTAALAAEGLFYLVMDEKGLVIINPQSVPMDELSADRAPLDAAMSEGPDLRTVYLADGQRIRLYTVAVRTDTGRVSGILQVGRPLESEEHALRMVELLFCWPACWEYSWPRRAGSFWPSARSFPSAGPSAGSRTLWRMPLTSCALR